MQEHEVLRQNMYRNHSKVQCWPGRLNVNHIGLAWVQQGVPLT